MARPSVFRTKITSLFQSHHLLSANEIVNVLRKKSPSLNKTTVYRVLDELCTSGVLCKYVFFGDTALYELKENHHDHTICEHCGTVEKVECSREAEPAINGFLINHHHMFYFGICVSCQEKMKNKKKNI